MQKTQAGEIKCNFKNLKFSNFPEKVYYKMKGLDNRTPQIP